MKDVPFTADRLLALYDRVAEAEDAIPRLRRFVLDLAVRGKLVEQDPSDEPAAELLKRIAKEKTEAEQHDRRGKKTVFSEIDAQGEAEPAGWLMVPLGEITRIRTGKLDANAAVAGGKFPFFTCSQTPLEIDTYSFDTEAILLAGNGDFNLKAYRGKFDAYQRTYVIEPVGWNLWFCFVLMRSHISKITNNQRGSAIPYLKLGDITSPIVPLPPLSEQQRIVAKVDELMALCDRLQTARAGREAVRDRLTAATLTRLTAPETDAETFPTHARFALQTLPTLTTRPDQIKTLRQTILNLAVRGKLTFDNATATGEPLSSKAVEKEEKPYSVHPTWNWVRMDEIVDFRGGSQPPKSTFIYKPQEGYTRLVQIRDFKSDAHMTFVPNDKANRPFTERDVMIGRYGPPVFQILRGLSGTYNVALMKAVADEKVLSSDFMFYLLQESRIHDEVVRESERTAGQTGVRLPLLNSFVVGLPPLAEQHRIVARVDALMALCDQLESSLTTATTTRSRLIEALLHEALGPAGQVMEAAE